MHDARNPSNSLQGSTIRGIASNQNKILNALGDDRFERLFIDSAERDALPIKDEIRAKGRVSREAISKILASPA